MQALELRFPGRYWDSLLYDGRLYLFTRAGEIRVCDWDRLVGELGWSDDLAPLAMQFLTRGRAWYAPEIRRLLQSPATFAHLSDLVSALTKRSFVVPDSAVRRSTVWELESPLFPHSDVEAYYNSLYIGSPEGLVHAPLARTTIEPFEQLLDAPALRISASYRSMAVAAGSVGLIELPLATRYEDKIPPRLVTEWHCQSCSWASFDIVASSPDFGGGFLAAYANPRDPNYEDERHPLLGLLAAESIFDRTGAYLFAAADKLILIGDGFVEAGKWSPYRRRPGYGIDVEKAKLKRQIVEDQRLRKEVLNASASVFGYVVEFDTALIVFANDGTSKRLNEPVSWRCFPRSSRYLNHLHVTLEDHLRIYAFVHDYFLQDHERGTSIARPTVTRPGD